MGRLRERADSRRRARAGPGYRALPAFPDPRPLASPFPTLLLPLSRNPRLHSSGSGAHSVFHPSVCVCPSGPLAGCLCQALFLPLLSFCLCPLKRSSLCILLFPSSSNHFGFLSGFYFFHLFSLYISSLHFCFFLFRPEAIWDGVGSFGNGIDRA